MNSVVNLKKDAASDATGTVSAPFFARGELIEEQPAFESVGCVVEELSHRPPGRVSQPGKAVSRLLTDPDRGTHANPVYR